MYTWFTDVEILVGAPDAFVMTFDPKCTGYVKESIVSLLGMYCATDYVLDNTVLVVRVIKKYPRSEVIRWIKALAAVPIPLQEKCTCAQGVGVGVRDHARDCPEYVPF